MHWRRLPHPETSYYGIEVGRWQSHFQRVHQFWEGLVVGVSLTEGRHNTLFKRRDQRTTWCCTKRLRWPTGGGQCNELQVVKTGDAGPAVWVAIELSKANELLAVCRSLTTQVPPAR